MRLIHIAGSFVLAAMAAACTNPFEPYDAIYITEAQESMEVSLTVDTPPAGTTFTVSSSVQASEDVTVTLEVRPDLIESYNSKYGKNYQMAPEGSYSLSSYNAVIEAGYNTSDAIEVDVTSIDEFAEGTTYCIPVSISSASSMKVLEPSRTLFVVLKTPVVSKAIYLGSNKYEIPAFQEDATLSALRQVTLEARVYVERFQSSDPYISSIMGIEGVCGVRFGDVKIDPNVVQICHDSYQPAATAAPCSTNTWYHIAAVWTGTTWDIYIDGRYITGTTTAGETIDLSSDNSGGFYLGASYGGGRYLYGYIAEARVWTRALSQSEIANNMNYVDPASEGLLAYWRMNAWETPGEGDYTGYGNVVRDETGHGYDAYGTSSSPTMMDTKWN
ncbi:MAG: DUF1735 domain-containing protein [Bacteroidetes bacterium]|uniref:DUF1735 domain-containing protein n=1 Tax=Candidatus Cryptobacteroides merdavium TaxID=2840769 RepID=A0A9D9EDP3_9BACT|nr:DUF1735 domain-containing protein [Candidatus Cryptobacteroides merdavium]